MNTKSITLSDSKKNLIALIDHLAGAAIGIMVILSTLTDRFDKDFWMYMIILAAICSSKGFTFNSAEDKKRQERKAAIIAIVSTVAVIVLYFAFKGIWILNAGCWPLFIGTATASFSIALLVLFAISRRHN